MPLYCSALGAVWPLRQENDFSSFYQPAICMNISAATAEPLRGRRQTIPPRPLRSSLPSPFTHQRLQNPVQPTRMGNEDRDLKSTHLSILIAQKSKRLRVESPKTVCLGTYRRDGAAVKGSNPDPICQCDKEREIPERLGQSIWSSGMPSSISITGMWSRMG